jgi:hypothetical protein
MKKTILASALALIICLGTAGCETSGTAQQTAQPSEPAATQSAAETASADESSYQSIYDEYTQKLKDAAPALVKEYNDEATSKAGDINALAALSNEKITKLAEICNEGVEKMAALKLSNGDSDDTYMEWAGKLQDVYTEQGQLITNAYMASAQG